MVNSVLTLSPEPLVKCYGHPAIVLEAVAAVPKMAAVLFVHLTAPRWMHGGEAHHRAINNGFASQSDGQPVNCKKTASYPQYNAHVRLKA